MDPTLAQILTYLFDLERQLAAANEEIDRLKDSAKDSTAEEAGA